MREARIGTGNKGTVVELPDGGVNLVMLPEIGGVLGSTLTRAEARELRDALSAVLR